MAFFSTLRRAVSTARDSVLLPVTLLSSMNKAISAVEKTAIKAEKTSDDVSISSVTFTSLCEKTAELLGKFTVIITPVFDFLSTSRKVWKVFCDIVCNLFSTAFKNSLDLWQGILNTGLEGFLLPCVIAVTCLICFFVYNYQLLGSAFTSLWSSVLCAVSSVIRVWSPESELAEWVFQLSKANQIVPNLSSSDCVATSSSSIGSVLSLVLAGFSMFFFSKQGFVARDDRNPILSCLKFAGSYAQQCNHLFTFHRNVKMDIGCVVGWCLDTACEFLHVHNPTLHTINYLLSGKDDIFKWIGDVERIVDPDDRLVKFADPSYVQLLKDLKQRGDEIRARCVVAPVIPFLSNQVHKAFTTLEKEYSACVSHKGIGQVRQEPFMVQFYGAPGVGKSRSLEFIVKDMLDLMEESQLNRLYSVPRKDEYWSGYAHQMAVLFDDLGAIQDAAGHNSDVKMIIDLKSSGPVGLPMADLESKGTHFTSKYIFATSNAPDPNPGCGIANMEAFQRRRDVLVEVKRNGDMNPEDPVGNLVYSVNSSFGLHNPEPGCEALSYSQLIRFLVRQAKGHFDKGKIMSSQLGHTYVPEPEPENLMGIEPQMQVEKMLLDSCKNHYIGDLAERKFLKEPFWSQYCSMSEEEQKSFDQWKNDLLFLPLREDEVGFWYGQVDRDWKTTVQFRLGMLHFDNTRLVKKIGNGSFMDCFYSDDDCVIEELFLMPPRTQFAYCLLARHHHSKLQSCGSKVVGSQSLYQRCVGKVLELFKKLPTWLQTILKVCVIYTFLWSISTLLSKFLSIPIELANACNTAIMAMGPKNESQSSKEVVPRKKDKRYDFFTMPKSHGPVEQDWAAWARSDPFLNQGLIKNVVLIKFDSGAYFRGLMIDSNWMMTIGHAFGPLPSGTQAEFVCDKVKQRIAVDKSVKHYITLPGQDVAFIHVMGQLGNKRNIIHHFVRQNQLGTYVGSQGCLVKASFCLDSTSPRFLENEVHGTRMQTAQPRRLEYGEEGAKIVSAKCLQYDIASSNGDCGSLLMLPNIVNNQPVIAGVHVAGLTNFFKNKGIYSGFSAVVTVEDLLGALPLTHCVEEQVHSRFETEELIKKGNPFDPNQVFYLGRVPSHLAAEIPVVTTLRKSDIFDAMEQIRPHTSEPSILTAMDPRLPRDSEFDPYIRGVEKFNETANCFNWRIAGEAFSLLKRKTLFEMSKIAVPGGIPCVRSEMVGLNGIAGEEYYDAMDFSTSVGWPFNKSGGKSKKEHVDGDPGEIVLKRDSPVFEAYMKLSQLITQGKTEKLVTTECAKDEKLPLEKIYEKPKTRLFTILPFHYNLLVRQYFLDFSAVLMRAHNVLPCKVGIDFSGSEWTLLANQFNAISGEGFSADYSSFDGRAPVFIFQWFCDMIDEFYQDAPSSEASQARHALIMMASCHQTLCGDHLFEVCGGMPSGFALTVIFNSILNEFYMRYAFGALLERPDVLAHAVSQSALDFERLFVAVYGDDNLVAVPLDLSWYTLPRIAEELLKVNVIIKSGLDKSANVAEVENKPLNELVFLSRSFVQHPTGFYQGPLKWNSVVERLYWIRKGKGLSAAEALEENVISAMEEAFYHGEVVFEALGKQLLSIFSQLMMPFPRVKTFAMMEQNWLQKVTQGPLVELDDESGKEILPEVAVVAAATWEREQVEVFPGVFCVSVRSYSHQNFPANTVVVNCTMSKKVGGIHGPQDWKDFENQMWGFTLSLIQKQQISMVAAGKEVSGVVFVSSTGDGMSVICASLLALSTSKYCGAAVLTRFRQITGVFLVSSYCGGAGAYLMRACGAGSNLQSQLSVGSLKSSLVPYHKLLSIGGCWILCGIRTPWVKAPGVEYWATRTTGFDGVNTSPLFVGRDVDGAALASAILKAASAEEKLFLFFDDFEERDARWVLKANVMAGMECYSVDAVCLARKINSIAAMGVMSVRNFVLCFDKKVQKPYDHFLTSGKKDVVLFENELGFEWKSVKEWRELVTELNSGCFRPLFVMTCVKMTFIIDNIMTYTHLKRVVEDYFGPRGSAQYLMALLHMILWLEWDVSLINLEQMCEIKLQQYFPQCKFYSENPCALNFGATTLCTYPMESVCCEVLQSFQNGKMMVSKTCSAGAFFYLVAHLKFGKNIVLSNLDCVEGSDSLLNAFIKGIPKNVVVFATENPHIV
uniref:RNA1 polyprotein n=1 Tax=Lophophytum mirabile torradovirus TaxID=3115801 RepID=A0AAT9JBA6_9SECO